MRYFLIFFALVLAQTINAKQTDVKEYAYAHSYIWEVTHNATNTTNYLFGTVHVDWRQVHDRLPSQLWRILDERTDVSVFEVDPNAAVVECFSQTQAAIFGIEPRLAMRILRVMGSNYQLLYSTHKKFVLFHLLRMVAEANTSNGTDGTKMTLNDMVQKATKKRENVIVLDNYLRNLAKLRGIEIRYVEGPACLPYPSLSDEELDFAIRFAVEQLERMPIGRIWAGTNNGGITDHQLELYLSGAIAQHNGTGAEKEPQQKFQGNDPQQAKMAELRRKMAFDMLERRNFEWIQKMDAWMQAEPRKRFLFAFGNAHFTAKHNSLIHLLEQRGYTVQELPRESTLAEHLGLEIGQVNGIFLLYLIAILLLSTMLLSICFVRVFT